MKWWHRIVPLLPHRGPTPPVKLCTSLKAEKNVSKASDIYINSLLDWSPEYPDDSLVAEHGDDGRDDEEGEQLVQRYSSAPPRLSIIRGVLWAFENFHWWSHVGVGVNNAIHILDFFADNFDKCTPSHRAENDWDWKDPCQEPEKEDGKPTLGPGEESHQLEGVHHNNVSREQQWGVKNCF